MAERPEHQVVLSGVGQSVLGRRLERTSMQLTIDAIQAAVDDAGLAMTDIDGIATFPGTIASYVPGFVGPGLWSVQDALGIQAGWHMSSFEGPSPLGPLMHAVLAVAAGLCRNAVVFRTMTESSGQAGGHRGAVAVADGQMEWLLPFGAVSGANWAGLYAARYFHEHDLTREHLGWVSVGQRAHAARNPDAVLRDPITIEDYLSARLISEPLGLLDCDLPIDGSTAVVVSAADQADDLRAPVRLEAMGGAVRHRPRWEQWDDITTMASHDAAAQMWSRTDLCPDDVDVAQLYDGFSVYVLYWLEAMGFCEPGEAAILVHGAKATDLGGALPLNTFGGQLSAGRLHGWGHLAEAMRQLRGEATGRQVNGAEVAAVGAGGGVMCAALLLSRGG